MWETKLRSHRSKVVSHLSDLVDGDDDDDDNIKGNEASDAGSFLEVGSRNWIFQF